METTLKQMEIRHIITVDGLAGTGKTTLSRMLAEKLGYAYLSSGMIYRAIGWLVLREGVDPHSESSVASLLKKHSLQLLAGEGGATLVLVNGQDISEYLKSPEISEVTSVIAQHPLIRAELVDLQRRAFPGHDLVAEGRDMGTVIFPEAELKFFITVEEQVALQRRLEQLREQMGLTAEDEIEALRQKMGIELGERDRRDATRSVAPVRAASDAVIIDNSYETLTQITQTMYDAASARGLVRNSDAG